MSDFMDWVDEVRNIREDTEIQIAMSRNAEEVGVCGENVTWRLNIDGTLIISGYGEMNDYQYDPQRHCGNTPWSNYANSIKVIIIKDGITSIGNFSFTGCSNLSSVSIADSVSCIGAAAFSDCYNLSAVTFSPRITDIYDYSFANCSSLTSVAIPDSTFYIGDHAFAWCDSLQSVTIAGDAPQLETDCFSEVNATIFYPANNPTWTDEVRQRYGGTLSWVAI